MSVRKLTLCGVFICFAAALSALETWLPPICPIPGVRVGLGNIVTLLVLYLGGKWRARDALYIALLRCVVAGLITGSPMNIAYGITGGVLALLSMTIATHPHSVLPLGAAPQKPDSHPDKEALHHPNSLFSRRHDDTKNPA